MIPKQLLKMTSWQFTLGTAYVGLGLTLIKLYMSAPLDLIKINVIPIVFVSGDILD